MKKLVMLVAAVMAVAFVGLNYERIAYANDRSIPSIGVSGGTDSISVVWTAPTDPPYDYRLAWGLNGGYVSYRASNTSTAGNAYPGASATSYTISGLDPGSYNVKLRARYDGSAGPWKSASSVQVEGSGVVVVVVVEPTAVPTAEPEPRISEEQQEVPTAEPTAEPEPRISEEQQEATQSTTDCSYSVHFSTRNCPLERPTDKTADGNDGTLTLGVEKLYTMKVADDSAVYKVRLEPGTKYRLTVRGANAGGGNIYRYYAGIGHLQTTCVSITGCKDGEGVLVSVRLDKQATNAPLVHPGSNRLTDRDIDQSKFYMEFKTPCILGSSGCVAGVQDYDYPEFYYAMVNPFSGAGVGDTVTIKVERLASSVTLTESPIDDQGANVLGLSYVDLSGTTQIGYVRSLHGPHLNLWNGNTISGNIDYATDHDRHYASMSSTLQDCKITPSGHGSDPANNLRLRSGDEMGATLTTNDIGVSSFVDVYSTSGDTGGYILTVSDCVPFVNKNTRGIQAEVIGPTAWSVGESKTVTFTTPSKGKDYQTVLYKIQLKGKWLSALTIGDEVIPIRRGTVYTLDVSGVSPDIRHGLHVRVVHANDDCTGRYEHTAGKRPSDGGALALWYGEGLGSGSSGVFQPIAYQSPRSHLSVSFERGLAGADTRSLTDDATGDEECYLIAVTAPVGKTGSVTLRIASE